MNRIVLSALASLVVVACQSTPQPAGEAAPATPAEPVAAAQPATPGDHSHHGDHAPAAPAAGGAPLFSDLGTFTRSVSSQNELARKYFSQGMTLTYGFNHAEAARSFREAARLDPKCAACYWGVALVLGPNINLGMQDTDVPEAFSASRKAQELAGNASPLERALIDALVTRYVPKPVPNRAELDLAYANAMRAVAKQYPDDADVLALFAESLMDLSPWDYWLPDNSPKPTTVELVAALERSMQINPAHPGALHYYIHAMEKVTPEKAVAAADRLWPLAPGAGHLVHMPAHIFIRVGRYKDAVDSNLQASAADKSYITQCKVQGFYPLAYYPHNWHFVWAAGTLLGSKAHALEGAGHTDHLTMAAPKGDPAFGGVFQHMALSAVFAATRFAAWDRIDAMPKPAAEQIYPIGIWHQARGSAAAARGDLATAEKELAEMKRILANPALAKIYVSTLNKADQILGIAERMLTADIAARRKDYTAAIAALEEGVRMEDALGYQEPEDWHYPVRLPLGQVLLDAGRAVAAEAAFRADLKKHPENGWALFGLEKALRAQGRTTDADAVQGRFEAAWKHADVKLTAAVIR
jgi:tetratricopeptide (TPR) repeat protein